MKLKLRWIEITLFAVVAAKIIYLLILKPIIGVADNGDFGRIMLPAGLEYMSMQEEGKYFGFIHRLYNVNYFSLWGGGEFLSTQIIPMKIAIVLNGIFTWNRLFDLRFMGIVYSVILLAAIYLIIRYSRLKSNISKWSLVLLIVLIFTDTGYLAYFNSFYGEAASYVFLLLTIGMAMYMVAKERPGIGALVMFFVSAIMFIGAKEQNCPIGIILALFGLHLLTLRKDKAWKRLVIASSITMVVFSVLIYFTIPNEIRRINQYQTVFFGILLNSEKPEKELNELDLNPKLAMLKGTTYYNKHEVLKNMTNPELLEEFYESMNYTKILKYYITHPSKLVEMLQISAREGFSIRQGYLGNYEAGSGRKFGELSHALSFWSDFKNSRLPHSLILLTVLYSAFFIILILQYFKTESIRNRIFIELLAIIGITGIVQFVVPIIGDGEGDLSKHLFMSNVCFDIIIAAGIIWVINLLSRRAGNKTKLKELTP